MISQESLHLLLIISLTDDSISTRRAAAAVLQEGIGRTIWRVEKDEMNEFLNDQNVISIDTM